MISLPSGVWPTMLTPFNVDKSIDYHGLNELVEFYTAYDIAGLFAACASSEVFLLTPHEILTICREIIRHVQGKIPVAAGVPKFSSTQDTADFIHKLAEEGVDVAVLLACNFAEQNDSNSVWIKNVNNLLCRIKNVPLGLYECPFPYHRLLDLETYQWVSRTGQFIFHKDTSCNIDSIAEKIRVSKGSRLSFFNAHTDTLIESLKLGGDGYSGVGANFYPELYVWIIDNYETSPILARELLTFLISSERVFANHYPAFAKIYLKLRGINISPACRVKTKNYTAAEMVKLEELLKSATALIHNVSSTPPRPLKLA